MLIIIKRELKFMDPIMRKEAWKIENSQEILKASEAEKRIILRNIKF